MERPSIEQVLTLREDWDGKTALHELLSFGAVAVPLLTEHARQVAYAGSWKSAFRHITTGAKPRSEYFSCYNPTEKCFGILQQTAALLLARKLGIGTFATPLEFNQHDLRIYPKGSRGLRIHRDKRKYKNLVLVILLEGDGEFSVYQNCDRTTRRIITAREGDGIIMRAPGLLGPGEEQPLHDLDNVELGRYVYMLRQVTPEESLHETDY